MIHDRITREVAEQLRSVYAKQRSNEGGFVAKAVREIVGELDGPDAVTELGREIIVKYRGTAKTVCMTPTPFF